VVEEAVETVVMEVVAVALQAVMVVHEVVVKVVTVEVTVPLALFSSVETETVSTQDGTTVLAVHEDVDEDEDDDEVLLVELAVED
jgi:hypothetical protein